MNHAKIAERSSMNEKIIIETHQVIQQPEETINVNKLLETPIDDLLLGL
jgi:hypothetical protein